MTTAIVDQPYPTGLGLSPAVRPARRRVPAQGPLARPERLAPTSPSRVGEAAIRGCRVSPVRRPAASWRLTDRGIALALVLTAILVLAAVTVIGLTAWRVTGPGYQAAAVSQISRR